MEPESSGIGARKNETKNAKPSLGVSVSRGASKRSLGAASSAKTRDVLSKSKKPKKRSRKTIAELAMDMDLTEKLIGEQNLAQARIKELLEEIKTLKATERLQDRHLATLRDQQSSFPSLLQSLHTDLRAVKHAHQVIAAKLREEERRNAGLVEEVVRLRERCEGSGGGSGGRVAYGGYLDGAGHAQAGGGLLSAANDATGAAAHDSTSPRLSDVPATTDLPAHLRHDLHLALSRAHAAERRVQLADKEAELARVRVEKLEEEKKRYEGELARYRRMAEEGEKRVKQSPGRQVRRFVLAGLALNFLFPSALSMGISDFFTSIGALHHTARILVIGLDNSGKSTLLDHISLNAETHPTPTPCFRTITFHHNTFRFRALDMSGQGRYRDMWEHPLRRGKENIDGVIWCLDATDQDRMEVVKREMEVLVHPEVVTGR
ncbi:hypothetical protein HDU93_001337 [Gonapodya sp. JEL0774]|nr:hypothetical protein HDU93_001337 [Gonapodya sp. JEL0774]